MKTKIYLLSFIAFAVTFISCAGSTIEPTKKDLNNYIAALSHYYPYTINDDFIFRNEKSGEKWENKPFVYDGNSTYPEAEIWFCDDPMASCYGDRTAHMYSYFIENGVSRYEYAPSRVATFIAKSGGSVDMYLTWDVFLSLGSYDYYQGSTMVSCSPREVLAQLTDTIIIPIQRQSTASGDIAAPDGAYARIVKDQGLSDFSIDGITIWQRVKE